MGLITPLLDTLLSQVNGRPQDLSIHASQAGRNDLLAAIRGAPGENTAEHSPAKPELASERTASRTSESSHLVRKPSDDASPLDGRGSEQAKASSVELHLSATANLLSRLLTTLRAGDAQKPLLGQTPIANKAAHQLPTSQLAAHLENTLVHSGLFYEAHLLAWSRGRYPLAQMTAESETRQAMSPMISPSADSTSHAPEASSPLPSPLAQQFGALDSGIFNWSGLLSRDVPMEWTVSVEPEGAQPFEFEPTSWTSTIHLQLPSLGQCDLRIRLVGQQLTVAAQVDNHVGRLLVAHDRSTITRRLDRIGLKAASIEVAEA